MFCPPELIVVLLCKVCAMPNALTYSNMSHQCIEVVYIDDMIDVTRFIMLNIFIAYNSLFKLIYFQILPVEVYLGDCVMCSKRLTFRIRWSNH